MSKYYEPKKNKLTKISRNHKEFQKFLKNKFYEYYIQIGSYLPLVLNAHLIIKVLLLDLTKSESIILEIIYRKTYS